MSFNIWVKKHYSQKILENTRETCDVPWETSEVLLETSDLSMKYESIQISHFSDYTKYFKILYEILWKQWIMKWTAHSPDLNQIKTLW